MSSIVALSMLPVSALATTDKGEAEKGIAKRPGRYKLGPLFLTPKLELNAGVQTNVYNSLTRAIPDAAIVLRPSLTGATPIGHRLRFAGEGYLDFNYFRREQSERSTDFSGQGRAELDVSSLTFFGGGGGGQARQLFSIDLDQRVLRQEKWATGGVKFAFTRKTSVTASGTGRVYTFGNVFVGPDNVKEALDRNELTASAQLRFAVTNQTTFLASAEAIEDRFLSQTGDAPRQVRSFRYLAGVELGERALVNGRVLAGIREFPGTSGGAPSYRGLDLAVSTSIPLLRFGRLLAIAERDVSYAVTSTRTSEDRLRNSYVSTRLRGEPRIDLPFDLIAQGSFGFEQAKYLLPYPMGDGFARRVDHLWTAGGSLLRRFGGSVRLGGTLLWTRRVSNFAGFSYQGLSYGLQAEVVP